MQRPTSIRTMLLILYFKMALILMNLPALFRAKIPEDISQSLYDQLVVKLPLELVLSALMVVFVRKRKYMYALICVLASLFIATMMFSLVATMVIVLLFFLRSTREYFHKPPQPVEDKDEPIEVDASVESDDGSEPADDAEEPAEAPSKPAAIDKPKSRKDPEITLREATADDADTVHSLMLIAFEEYRRAVPPSSALDETSESVHEALSNGSESAVLLYEDDVAVAMARFKIEADAIYFFRLSVVPSKRRRGYARRLVKWIEHYGTSKNLNASRCKVRQTVQNNVRMYQDMGYEIIDQELVVRDTGSVKALLFEKSLRPQ